MATIGSASLSTLLNDAIGQLSNEPMSWASVDPELASATWKIGEAMGLDEAAVQNMLSQAAEGNTSGLVNLLTRFICTSDLAAEWNSECIESGTQPNETPEKDLPVASKMKEQAQTAPSSSKSQQSQFKPPLFIQIQANLSNEELNSAGKFLSQNNHTAEGKTLQEHARQQSLAQHTGTLQASALKEFEKFQSPKKQAALPSQPQEEGVPLKTLAQKLTNLNDKQAPQKPQKENKSTQAGENEESEELTPEEKQRLAEVEERNGGGSGGAGSDNPENNNPVLKAYAALKKEAEEQRSKFQKPSKSLSVKKTNAKANPAQTAQQTQTAGALALTDTPATDVANQHVNTMGIGAAILAGYSDTCGAMCGFAIGQHLSDAERKQCYVQQSSRTLVESIKNGTLTTKRLAVGKFQAEGGDVDALKQNKLYANEDVQVAARPVDFSKALDAMDNIDRGGLSRPDIWSLDDAADQLASSFGRTAQVAAKDGLTAGQLAQTEDARA